MLLNIDMYTDCNCNTSITQNDIANDCEGVRLTWHEKPDKEYDLDIISIQPPETLHVFGSLLPESPCLFFRIADVELHDGKRNI